MQCPMEGEDTLSQIVDSREELVCQIAEKVKRFKEILLPAQKRIFNEIEDLMHHQLATAQQDTVKKIHCPTCRNRKRCQ